MASESETDQGSDGEQRRLEALERYDLLDTPREEAFDRLVRVTKSIFQVPIAAITLIDAHRQWFKAAEGMSEACEISRKDSFCSRMIRTGEPLVVPDASVDPRFVDNSLVTGETHLRFYAGVPLTSEESHTIGSLCIADREPRPFAGRDVALLRDLGNMAADELQLRLLATKDALTGVMTRRAFREQASRTVALALRHHHDLACVALDLDRFKAINDTYGHAAGDRVLVAATLACVATLRSTDLIGRLGGEEFAVILPNTGPTGAMQAAERIRAAIESAAPHVGSGPLRFTASLGVSSLGATARDLDTLLAQADEALYRAKDSGRNRCVAYKPPTEGPSLSRRRVLKAGRILFNGRTSSMDCTIRSLSDDGAGLDVSSSTGVPAVFALTIKGDAGEKTCRVLQQTERHLDVAFA